MPALSPPEVRTAIFIMMIVDSRECLKESRWWEKGEEVLYLIHYD
jgi:hypothetical protein